MVRALGLHRTAERVHYALVERREGAPPEVLASGEVLAEELVQLHGRLSGERPLPWGLADEGEAAGSRELPAGWPLRRPSTRALLRPAIAAATWEWELGRITEHDLLLWLRPERLLWSLGEPGRGRFSSEPRRGPLRETLSGVLRDAGSKPTSVVLAVDGDAPGAHLLEDELGHAGKTLRRSRRSAEERGADRAAAGAALAALDPLRPGVFAPVRPRRREPLLWTASVLAAATVGGGIWQQRVQERAMEGYRGSVAQPAAGRSQPETARPAPVPDALQRLLARRRAMLRSLEDTLAAVPEGRLEELELLTAPSSARARLRLRLLPGGEAGEDWLEQLPGGAGLESRPLRDGGLLLRGEVDGERAPAGGG